MSADEVDLQLLRVLLGEACQIVQELVGSLLVGKKELISCGSFPAIRILVFEH